MVKLLGVVILLLVGTIMICSEDAQTKSAPLSQHTASSYFKTPAYSNSSNALKAMRLFFCARKANRRLKWDSCLADRAAKRAKDMVRKNQFSHKDPGTGKNKAWDLIASCYSYRYGGENLIKGNSSPQEMHDLLMKSPAHRRNILNQRFDRLGIGCHHDVCVQLFAGF